MQYRLQSLLLPSRGRRISLYCQGVQRPGREIQFRLHLQASNRCAGGVGSLIKEAEKEICGKDHLLQIEKASQQYTDICSKLATSTGWRRLWDHSLDHGRTCVTSLKNLVRILTYPKHATRQCPLCEGIEFDSLLEHVMSDHTSSSNSWDVLQNSLTDLDPSCFSHFSCFYKLFNSS